jgi:hypothetical protein
MSFRNATSSKSAATPNQNQGRTNKYAAIRPAQPRNNKIKPGEYIFEFVRTYKSRTEGTFMFDGKIVELLEGGDKATQAGEVALGLINIAGKSYDIGMPVLVSLTMALCGCETQEQLNAEEPEWDLLLDALCEEERGTSSEYGLNPAAGKRVWMRCWHSQKLDKEGNPYQNFEFRAHFEDGK